MKYTRGQFFSSILCLLPFSFLGFGFFSDQLTANPIQALTLQTGRMSVYLLLLTLLCSPIRNLIGLSALIPIRKTLGVFSFFYALSHFLVFIILDYQLNWEWIRDEIRFKLFLQIGSLAIIILFFLAITSFKIIQKKLGKSWSTIHKFVFPATGLVIIHIFLSAKGDYFLPIQLSILFSILILLRLPIFKNKRLRNSPSFIKKLNIYLLNSPKWIK